MSQTNLPFKSQWSNIPSLSTSQFHVRSHGIPSFHFRFPQQHQPTSRCDSAVQVPLSMGEDGCGVACCASGCSSRISGEGGCGSHRSRRVAVPKDPKGLGHWARCTVWIPTVDHRWPFEMGKLVRFTVGGTIRVDLKFQRNPFNMAEAAAIKLQFQQGSSQGVYLACCQPFCFPKC